MIVNFLIIKRTGWNTAHHNVFKYLPVKDGKISGHSFESYKIFNGSILIDVN